MQQTESISNICSILDYTLSAEQRTELRAARRSAHEKRDADHIKALVLLATGWTADQVARALGVDANTVRNHFKRYRQGGIEALRRIGTGVSGSAFALDADQLASMDAHPKDHLYLSAKAIACCVEDTFGVSYTESGMIAVLYRLDCVYKKPKLVPGKADPEAQREFLRDYENINKTKDKEDPVYFMDSLQPQHNPVIDCGWIKRGEDQEVPSNIGRRRVNINGAIDLERLEPVVRFDDTINVECAIALFKQLVQRHFLSTCIYVICDNACYYHSKAIQEYLKTSRIKLVFLPPYAPTLNLIERLRKFFEEKICTIAIEKK